ncbi:MAG TPA: SRPBCC family protein [Ktedonobacterales bacterium]
MDFTIDIARPVEQVFALIADLPNYHRWLPPSGLYGTTTQVSDTPVTLGTIYVDGKQAKLHGRVTEYRPPFALAFHQEAGLLFSRLSIDIRYRLEPLGAHTRVHRTTTPRLSGMLALLQPLIVRPIRNENRRTLAMMKQYLEQDVRA